SPKKQGTKDCHGSPLGAEEVAATRKQLGWDHPPFVLPENILDGWRKVGARGAADQKAWNKRYMESRERVEFDRVMRGDLPRNLDDIIEQLKKKVAADKPKHATRQSSGAVLETILPAMPELIGGSADLTPSNNTQVKHFAPIKPDDYKGRYIHF